MTVIVKVDSNDFLTDSTQGTDVRTSENRHTPPSITQEHSHVSQTDDTPHIHTTTTTTTTSISSRISVVLQNYSMKFLATAALALLCTSSQVSGFAPVVSETSPSTSLKAWNDDAVKKATRSLVAATFLLGGVVSATPAFAFDETLDFGSSQVVAARSGGRAGGRSAGARAAPRPSSHSSTTINTRVIERTRYIPSPSYSPGIIIAPPVYNPLPGYGLGLGLNAINQIGNDMRDYRQENEIRDARYQLEQARMKEAELDARLRQLENSNNNQAAQLTQQQLIMLQQQQQQLQQALPAASN
jgi:hypothetical protein